MTRRRISIPAVRSLRGLLILYLCLVLLPVLLVQLWVYGRQLEAQRLAELRANVEIARAVASSFESYIFDLRSQELAVGRAMVSFSPTAQEHANHYLAQMVKDSPTLVALSWVQASGRVAASDQRQLVGKDWNHTEWFERLAGGEEWVVAHLPPRADPDAAVFSVWQAIWEKKTLLGVVVAEVRASHLTTVLDVWRSDRGAISLVDSNGWLVYRQPSVAIPEHERNWGRRFSVFEHALEGLELAGVEYVPYEHQSLLMAAVPIPALGWAAGAGRAEEEALAPVVQNMLGSFLLLLLVAAAAALLVAVAAKRITGPLARLHTYSRAVGRGEFHRELAVKGPSELRALAGAFIRMAGEIQAREQALAEEARVLETILENIDTSVVYLDTELRFVQTNSAFARFAGWTRADMLGKRYQEVVPFSTVLPLLSHVCTTGASVHSAERPVDHPIHGRMVWNIAIVPVRGEAGSVTGLIFAAHEMTQEVQTRERAVSAERARAELAEHLNDEIAHRVKNNLAMVSGLLQMQAIKLKNPELEIALRDAVSRVRTFAQIHEQMYKGQANRIDLLSAVRRVAEMNQEIYYREQGVEIAAGGDSVYLPSRAVTNLSIITNELITNALKHGQPTEEGVHRVTVHVTEQDAHVVLEVWNSGNPVPEGFAINGHSGMGLLLVTSLVRDQYGGTFTLTPHDNGTLAHIRLAAAQCLPSSEAV